MHTPLLAVGAGLPGGEWEVGSRRWPGGYLWEKTPGHSRMDIAEMLHQAIGRLCQATDGQQAVFQRPGGDSVAGTDNQGKHSVVAPGGLGALC